jgi:hypothetical protein
VYARGVLGILEENARLLTENYITMNLSTILARAMLTITATNNQDKESVDLWLKKLKRGDISAIGELPAMVGNQDRSINITPFQNVASILTDLIEERQYIKASFFNELGLNSNYNMKRESINSNESQLNDDMLHPLIDEMLEMRREALAEVNAMFGTNITVDFNSAWKDNEIEAELTLDAMENEADGTDNMEVPDAETVPEDAPDAGEETSDVSEQGEENEAEVIEEQPEEQAPELAEVIEELTDAVEEVADALTDEQPEEEKEDV